MNTDYENDEEFEDDEDIDGLYPQYWSHVIHAWAEGYTIQMKNEDSGEWKDCENPSWDCDDLFRVKPAPAKIRGWINIYSDLLVSQVHQTKEIADREKSERLTRLDCVEIEYDGLVVPSIREIMSSAVERSDY